MLSNDLLCNVKQTMYILQGPPGSGKSTLAEGLFHVATRAGHLCLVASTDDYFYRLDPDAREVRYDYKADQAAEAHLWNQERVRRALTLGDSVVVDNTNIRAWEARPYVEMAVERGIPVVFIRLTADFGNVHGVPEEVVEGKRRSLEDLTVEKCLAARYPWEVEAEELVQVAV